MESGGKAPRRVLRWKAPPITLGDRVVTAVVSALAAAATAAGIAILILLMAQDVVVAADGWRVLWRWSLAFVALCAAAGFAVGPERAAYLWGVLWGTEEGHGEHGPLYFIVAMVLATAMAFFLVTED